MDYREVPKNDIICMYVCVCIYIYICVCVHVYIYMCVCVYLFMCLFTCMYMYIYIYTWSGYIMYYRKVSDGSSIHNKYVSMIPYIYIYIIIHICILYIYVYYTCCVLHRIPFQSSMLLLCMVFLLDGWTNASPAAASTFQFGIPSGNLT